MHEFLAVYRGAPFYDECSSVQEHRGFASFVVPSDAVIHLDEIVERIGTHGCFRDHVSSGGKVAFRLRNGDDDRSHAEQSEHGGKDQHELPTHEGDYTPVLASPLAESVHKWPEIENKLAVFDYKSRVSLSPPDSRFERQFEEEMARRKEAQERQARNPVTAR